MQRPLATNSSQRHLYATTSAQHRQESNSHTKNRVMPFIDDADIQRATVLDNMVNSAYKGSERKADYKRSTASPLTDERKVYSLSETKHMIQQSSCEVNIRGNESKDSDFAYYGQTTETSGIKPASRSSHRPIKTDGQPASVSSTDATALA